MTKFKAGDKVKLTTTEQVSQHVSYLKVGDIGVILGNFVLPTIFIVDFENIEPDLKSDFAFKAFELEFVE